MTKFAIAGLALSALLWQTATAQTELLWRGDAAASRAFITEIAELYEAQRRAPIVMEYAATSVGVAAVAADEADLAGSARPQSTTRIEEMRVTFHPIVWDALVAIAHPNNPVRNLSIRQLRDVYTGSISNWKDVGGEDAPIEIVRVDAPLDGIEYSLRQLLLGNGAAEVRGGTAVAGTLELEQAVENGRHAIGITTYSAARRLRVKILALEGRSASPESIASGEYLLFVPLYLVARQDGRSRFAVRDVVRLAQSPQLRRVVRRNGVVPYADGLSLVARQMEREGRIERALRE